MFSLIYWNGVVWRMCSIQKVNCKATKALFISDLLQLSIGVYATSLYNISNAQYRILTDFFWSRVLTHCDLVTPYVVGDIGQQRWHQFITRTNAYLQATKYCGIRCGITFDLILKITTHAFCLDLAHLTSYPLVPRSNELNTILLGPYWLSRFGHLIADETVIGI